MGASLQRCGLAGASQISKSRVWIKLTARPGSRIGRGLSRGRAPDPCGGKRWSCVGAGPICANELQRQLRCGVNTSVRFGKVLGQARLTAKLSVSTPSPKGWDEGSPGGHLKKNFARQSRRQSHPTAAKGQADRNSGSKMRPGNRPARKADPASGAPSVGTRPRAQQRPHA